MKKEKKELETANKVLKNGVDKLTIEKEDALRSIGEKNALLE